MTEDVKYEYAIKLALTGVIVYPDLTEQQALGMLAALLGRGAKHGTFELIRRQIGEWEGVKSDCDGLTTYHYW